MTSTTIPEKPAKFPAWAVAIGCTLMATAVTAAGGAYVQEQRLEVRVDALEENKKALDGVPSQLAIALDRIDALTKKVDGIDAKLDRKGGK